MDLLRHLDRLFVYDDWANRETLAALRQASPGPARSLKLLAHIVAAEWLWLGRLRGDVQKMPVWPDLSLEQCAAEVKDLQTLWKTYMMKLTAGSLMQEIDYTNTKGERWSSTPLDVLTHVTHHSAYHRGQIAADLRQAGHTPAYTDFIHAVRQGFVE